MDRESSKNGNDNAAARGSREVAPHVRVVGGDDVVIDAPDSLLEEVGESCMIATHGVSDIKTFGRACAHAVASILLLRSRSRGRRPPPDGSSERIN